MLIANPIYDVTFKRLLENDRTAKFFIGTILNCKILSLVPKIQERSKIDKETGNWTLFRMDFAAEIETKEEGKKSVIIEMQKALHLGDVYRFKDYLGEEYKRSEIPIISIYVLGFNLSVDSPAFVARPNYRDLRTNEELAVHDSFVELLTHSAYFIQTRKIKPSHNTILEKLLSVFEQANFVDNSEKTKEFLLEADDPDIKEVLSVLHYVAMDKATREELDKEEYYQKAMLGIVGKTNKELAETKENLDLVNKELAEHKEALSQKDQALSQKDQALSQKDQEIEELRKQLEALKK